MTGKRREPKQPPADAVTPGGGTEQPSRNRVEPMPQTERERQNEGPRTPQGESTAERTRYLDLFDLAPVGYCLLSEQGLILEGNLTAAALLGLERSALSAQPLARFVLDADREILCQLRRRLAETRQPQECDLRLLRPDGAFFWARLAANAALSAYGAPTFRLVFSDITGCKKHEEELRIAGELSERIIEDGPVAITQVDRNGSIVFANRQAECLFGLERSSIQALVYNAPDWLITDLDGSPFPDERLPFRQVIANDHAVYDVQHAITMPDSSRKMLSISAAPLHDRDGRIDRVVCAIIDITARKRAEQLVQEKNQEIATRSEELNRANEELLSAKQDAVDSSMKYRALYERAPLSYQSLNEDGCILDVNPMWLRTLGYEREEVIGSWFGSFLHPDYVERFRENFPEFKKRGHISGITFKLRRKDDTYIHVSFDGSVGYTPEGKFRQTYCVFRDITEQNRIEVDLAESERMLSHAQEISHTGSWRLDLATDQLTWSDETYRIFGYEPQEFSATYQGFLDCVHPDDRAAVGEAFSMSLHEGRDGYETEHRIVRHTSGEVRYVHERCVHERDDAGRAIRSVGMVQDITERRRSEEHLRKFERIVSSSSEGISLVNKDYQYVIVNDAYEFFSGRKKEDFIGMTVAEYIGEEAFREKAKPQLDKCLEGETIRYRDWFEYPTLGRRFVEVTYFPYVDARGEISGVVANTRDITDYKKAEDQLREKEAFQDLLMAMATKMINVPLKCVEDQINSLLGEIGQFSGLDRVYIFYNDYDRRISINTHEWCADGIEPVIDLLQEVPLDEISRVVETHRRGEPFIIPRVSDLPEGDTIREIIAPQGILSLLLIPLIHHGDYFGYVGFDAVRKEVRFTQAEVALLTMFAELVVNVKMRQRTEAEREGLQAQLLQAQKMESIGRLAGGVAHDFNNMLHAILGHTEMAQEQVPAGDPLHADLVEIQKAAQRSAELTRQLLAFARKQTVSRKVLDLNATIGNMLSLIRRLIGEDIDLAWKPGKDIWPVKLDPAQVDQILANLCVNSRDAIQGVGKIIIETAKVSFDEEYCVRHAGFVPGDYVVLAVTDNGCGMNAETRSHLFEPFFTTKEVGRGTGLGLASVYGAVQQNNGFISVCSEPGQGATFRIYLPRHMTTEALAVEGRQPLAAARGQGSILLVEDEPSILRMIATMLERMGYTVLAAGTPGEAIRLARESLVHIDLLMVDVVMPEMNGRALAESLLSIHPGMRRLFMSGYTADVIAHHGVLDADVHFIQKPFSSAKLTAKLREVLEG